MKHPTWVEPSQRSTLTKEQKLKLLYELEAPVRNYIAQFKRAGDALMEIKDKRLYQLRGFKDFGAYVAGHLDFSRTHAERLIEAARAYDVVTPVGGKPRSERSLRPLLALSPEQQRTVWKEATERAKGPRKITGTLVAKVRHELYKDGKGYLRKPSPLVDRHKLIAALKRWYSENKELQKLAPKAVMCEILKFIKGYGQ